MKILTNEKINKDIHQHIMGGCIHAFAEGSSSCWYCGIGSSFVKYPSYTTDPVAYFDLLKKIKITNKWKFFIQNLVYQYSSLGGYAHHASIPVQEFVADTISDMHRGCKAIHDFFCKGVE